MVVLVGSLVRNWPNLMPGCKIVCEPIVSHQ